MAQPTLSAEQTKKAITALLKYVGKEAQESKDLFDDDAMLCLVRHEIAAASLWLGFHLQ